MAILEFELTEAGSPGKPCGAVLRPPVACSWLGTVVISPETAAVVGAWLSLVWHPSMA